MCGIVGAIAQRNVTNILITGLKRLEYRGYDSAGVALLNDSGITRVRRQGKVAGLESAIQVPQPPSKAHLTCLNAPAMHPPAG